MLPLGFSVSRKLKTFWKGINRLVLDNFILKVKTIQSLGHVRGSIC